VTARARARARACAAAAVLTAATALLPAAAPGAGNGGPTVKIIDNAFVRDRHRPVVRVDAGTTVTWRWASRQSHNVLVDSGPQRFSSAMRSRGTFAHRFTRAGTYKIVCSLHAPGMRMTVRVAR
jgi:plastocyanin